MLIDEQMPQFDATRIEHRVIEGSPERLYRAVRESDFMEIWRSNRIARALGSARTVAERLASGLRGREFQEYDEPTSLRLADLPAHGDWVLLGEDAPNEIAFGVIGRFWAGETAWRQIDASEFRDFAEPGYARIACGFSFRPYGEARTLVTYESRTQAVDPQARRGFLRYWRLVSPGAGLIMRAQLAEVAKNAADLSEPWAGRGAV